MQPTTDRNATYLNLIMGCLVASVLAQDRFQGPGLNQGYSGSRGYAPSAARSVNAEGNYPSMPFSFGYDTVDEYGTKLFHKEQSDANNARTGSYGYMDANGIYRRVNYVADANGFRATIETNEPGTQAGRSADAIFNARPVAAGTRLRAPGGFGASAAYGRGGLARSGSSQHGSSVSANNVYNQAAAGRPGYKQGGHGKAGYGQAGIVQAGIVQTGIVQAGNVQAGIAQAGYGQTGHSQSEKGRTGYSQSGRGQSGYGKAGYIQDGNSQAVYDRTRYDPHRSAHHAKSHAGFASRS